MIEINQIINQGTCGLHPDALKRDIAMEECSELIQAISKVNRDKIYARPDEVSEEKRLQHRENEIEEIADVLLIIETLKYIDDIDDKDIQKWIYFKQARQVKRDYDLMNSKSTSYESGSPLNKYIQYCEEHHNDDEE